MHAAGLWPHQCGDRHQAIHLGTYGRKPPYSYPEETETRPNFEYGKRWKREPGRHDSPIGNAHKCHFCLHRIENGLLPACVTTCLGGATYFGDYNDKTSMVNELVGASRMMRLKEELGTQPMTFYLV